MFVYYSVIPGDAIIFSDWSGPIDLIKGEGPMDHNKVKWERFDGSDMCWMVPGTYKEA